MDEMKQLADNKPGFIKAMWCGQTECETALKTAVTSCMPFERASRTACAAASANHMVVWGRRTDTNHNNDIYSVNERMSQ